MKKWLDQYQSGREVKYNVPTGDNLQYQKPLVSNFIVDPLSGGYVHDPARAAALLNQPTNAGIISKTKDRSVGKQIYNVATNPMTSAQQLINKQPVTGLGPKNPYDLAFDAFPAMMAARQLPQIPGNIQRGEYLQAGLNALTAVPLLPKVPRRLSKVYSEGQPYEGAPHIYQDMYSINGRYQPRTVITDAGVKNEILGLEPTPVVPTNAIEYPVTPNKFLNQTYDDFGRMEEGLVGNTTPSTQESIWNNILRNQSPNSNTSYSIVRNPQGQIQFLDNETYRKALVTGKNNVINYLSDPRYAAVVEQNQQLANRLGINQVLPIQKEMVQPSLYKARLQKINEPLDINDPRELELQIINNNSNVGAQYTRTLGGKGSLTVPRVYSPEKIIGSTEHEVLHHIYPNLGEGYPSFTPLEIKKAKSVFKDAATLRKIEEQHGVPLWYLDDVDELVPNSFDLAKQLGIKKFEKYPGMESFKKMLDSYSGDKIFVKDALKLNNSRDYKRAWDMLSGIRLGIVPAIGVGAALNQKQQGGPIVTNRGQWDYPGQTTIIPSNKITMTGVDYPVLGVDNTGYTKIMQPGMNYTFPGQYVTEYPIFKHGGEMIKRADGSYSRRGLWDNLRDNRGSGKAPTKEMLEQERKIKNQYQQGGVVLNTGGEKHRIYVKSTNRGEGAKGHIMVNHPTMDKGIWDTIDLTEKAGATTIAQGVAATKKWHRENPYKKQDGGEEINWYYPKQININEGFSYYEPNTETYYFNPNNDIQNQEAVKQHELYHHLQNINGRLQLPQYYSGPLKKPNMMMNGESQGVYYNRRGIDEEKTYNIMVKRSPELQFVPRDILYNGMQGSNGHIPGTNDMMYENPYTVEGEARDYENYIRAGGKPIFANGGYVVRRSHDRKGKTHVVIGPDGTKKYFGDPNMGERGKSKYGKEAFYARHKKNLAKNPYFRAYARATWEEGGEIPQAQNGAEKNNQSYQIQKGDTLLNISTKYNVPLNTLANVNNIQNPNLIKTGNQLIIPKKFDRELKYEEIPTTDNKKIVIDNFSPHYDYIIEGDKTYYKTKNGKTWADISDNESARNNLLNFINKNNYWAGYESNEKEKFLNIPITKLNNKNLISQVPVSQIPFYDFKVPVYKQPYLYNQKTQVKTPVIINKKQQNNNDVYNDIYKSLNEISTTFNSGINTAANKIGDLYQTAINGIKRKYATHTGNDNDFAIKESLIPKSLQEYYSQKIPGDITIIDVPDNSGRQYKQEILPISNIKFGVRNRGEYKNINTEGLEITSFNPFNNKVLPDEASVLALDPNGNLHTGQYKDFKNNNGYLFSKTFKNNIVDFSESSGKNEYIDGAKSGNPKYKQPKVKVLNDQGKIIDGSLNILVKGDDKKDYYGSIQGGRILFVNPTTKEQYLVAGSVDYIKKKFKELKGDNKYLEAYTLDNGTYSRGLSYKDKKLTKDRLKAYDLENTSGGNGLYILNYNQPINKYPENYLQTPNVRTVKDDSYKKGHALKNEIKNIVLHHTAYTNPLTNEEEVRKQYMSPGANTSHVVIEEDGKRTIYASPEQVTFHAGESKWKNRNNVNDFSIGVEFQGDTNKQPLTQSQIESFIEYYTPIAKKYNLSVKDIITHQMIAPGRKPDISDKEYKKILNYMKSKGYKKQGGQIMAIGGQSTLNPIVKKDNRNWLDYLKN